MSRTQRSTPRYYRAGLIVLLTACTVPLVYAGAGIERITLTSPHGVVGVYPTAGPEAAFESSAVQQTATVAAGWEKLTCPGGLYLRQVSMVSPQVGYIWRRGRHRPQNDQRRRELADHPESGLPVLLVWLPGFR